MNIPQYDIFSGSFGQNAVWLEAVEEPGNAVTRMKAIAAGKPGPYFVLCLTTHCVLASVDTADSGEAEITKSA
jgi:hypothetical protein